MNASRMTILLAQGVVLRAKVQDQPMTTPAGGPTPERLDWETWSTRYPGLAPIAIDLQNKAFDACLSVYDPTKAADLHKKD